MTNTDKILAEFDEKFPNESFREWTMGCFYQDELRKQFLKVRAFLSTSISQALAEERSRVRRKVIIAYRHGIIDGKKGIDCEDLVIKIALSHP